MILHCLIAYSARTWARRGSEAHEVTSMKPPHNVWRSKLAILAWMINKAIDNGNYDVEIKEVRRVTSQGRVMPFIRETLPSHYLLDLSLFTPEDEQAVNEWFEGLNGNYDIHVEKRGLCLLLAWTIEMMQHAGGPRDNA